MSLYLNRAYMLRCHCDTLLHPTLLAAFKIKQTRKKQKRNRTGDSWRTTTVIGPLIMTHFLSAPPWDDMPPPHLHTRTCTHGVVSAAHIHTPTDTRTFSPNAEDIFAAEKRSCPPKRIFSG